MESDTLVSIIVPTHNKASTLSQTLLPLVSQTNLSHGYEVIVIDNNSTDTTQDLLQQLTLLHPRITHYRENHRGAGAARNRGIVESRGELLVFVDDDVLVSEDHLAKHLNYHTHSAVPVCVVGFVEDRTQYPSRVLHKYMRAKSSISARGQPKNNPGLSLAAGNFSIKRSTLDRVEFMANGRRQYFDETFGLRQDGELGYRLEKAGVNLIYTQDIYCEHQHIYKRGDIARRAYRAGYFLHRLYQKHPELERTTPHRIIRNARLNSPLLVAGGAMFGVGFFLQWVSPWLMFKGIGAWLTLQASKGYQQSVKDIHESARNE